MSSAQLDTPCPAKVANSGTHSAFVELAPIAKSATGNTAEPVIGSASDQPHVNFPSLRKFSENDASMNRFSAVRPQYGGAQNGFTRQREPGLSPRKGRCLAPRSR